MLCLTISKATSPDVLFPGSLESQLLNLLALGRGGQAETLLSDNRGGAARRMDGLPTFKKRTCDQHLMRDRKFHEVRRSRVECKGVYLAEGPKDAQGRRAGDEGERVAGEERRLDSQGRRDIALEICISRSGGAVVGGGEDWVTGPTERWAPASWSPAHSFHFCVWLGLRALLGEAAGHFRRDKLKARSKPGSNTRAWADRDRAAVAARKWGRICWRRMPPWLQEHKSLFLPCRSLSPRAWRDADRDVPQPLRKGVMPIPGIGGRSPGTCHLLAVVVPWS